MATVTGGGSYRVKAGDNLWSIAENIFGDGRAMKRIMYLNGMNSTTVRPGMTLKLPTVVAGRNDQFRITNAEANDFGLASQQQIASGSGYAPGWKGNNTLPVGDDMLKGVKPSSTSIGIGVAGTSASEMRDMIDDEVVRRARSNSTMGIGVAGTSASQLRNQVRAQAPNLGIGVAGTSASEMRQKIEAQRPTYTPPRAPVQPVRGPYQHEEQRLAMQDRTTTTRPQTGSIFDTIREALGITVRGTADVMGPGLMSGLESIASIAPAVGEGGEGYLRWSGQKQRAQAGEVPVNQDGQDAIEEGRQPSMWDLRPVTPADIRDLSFTQQNLKVNPTLINQWNEIFTNFVTATGTPPPHLPANVVGSLDFPISLDDLRAMGYVLSEDGKQFQLAKRGKEAPLPTAYGYSEEDINPYTGRSSNSGGYYGSSGGGYSGGGGGGNNSYKATPLGFLRATGSWKGQNFG